MLPNATMPPAAPMADAVPQVDDETKPCAFVVYVLAGGYFVRTAAGRWVEISTRSTSARIFTSRSDAERLARRLKLISLDSEIDPVSITLDDNE
jgi:hypothetical protein